MAHIKKPPELPVEGWPRPYIRDGVPGLPIERQSEMLMTLGLDLSDEKKIWMDRVSRPRIKARGPLPMRDEVVNPRHFGETIYIAGLRVLGWDNLDVMRAATKAFEKQCRIYCADTGVVFSAETPASEILKALTLAEEARRRARTKRATEGQVSRQANRLSRGLAIARRLWPGPMTVDEIAKEAGLSRRTLYEHLPSRDEARDEKKRGKKHV